MSDLISRKALLEKIESASVQVREIEDKKLLTIDLYDAIRLIINAPAITQGEPMAWISDDENFIEFRRDSLLELSYKENEIFPLYTAPPQPQSVKDALEKAAMIVQAKIGHYYPTPLTDAVTEIRALIED